MDRKISLKNNLASNISKNHQKQFLFTEPWEKELFYKVNSRSKKHGGEYVKRGTNHNKLPSKTYLLSKKLFFDFLKSLTTESCDKAGFCDRFSKTISEYSTFS